VVPIGPSAFSTSLASAIGCHSNLHDEIVSGGEIGEARLERGHEITSPGPMLTSHHGKAAHDGQQILQPMGQLAIQQVMRLRGMPPLRHVEAEPRHDRGRALFVALEDASLEAEPAELAVAFWCGTTFMQPSCKA
jgi:hypothetical protein